MPSAESAVELAALRLTRAGAVAVNAKGVQRVAHAQRWGPACEHASARGQPGRSMAFRVGRSLRRPRRGAGGCCVHGVAVASATVVAHGVLGDREVQERRPP